MNLASCCFLAGMGRNVSEKYADWQLACSISAEAESPVRQRVDRMLLWDGKCKTKKKTKPTKQTKSPFVLLGLILMLQEFCFKRKVKQCLY